MDEVLVSLPSSQLRSPVNSICNRNEKHISASNMCATSRTSLDDHSEEFPFPDFR